MQTLVNTYQNRFKKELTLKNSSEKGRRVYRYGFNGMEKDNEVSGAGNSYDFGARMYNPRVGRFFSIDAYASHFPYQSPYIFAGNTPIMAIDNNGDSTLFYSSHGDYLGYAHDSQKNMVVTIDDVHLAAFKREYERKRFHVTPPAYHKTEASKKSYIEEIVGGLRAMGDQYDIDAFKKFHSKYAYRLKSGEIVSDSKDQVEWGDFLVKKEGIITLKGKPFTSGLHIRIYWTQGNSEGAIGDMHLHNDDPYLKSGASDMDSDRAKNVWNKENFRYFNIIGDGGKVYFYKYGGNFSVPKKNTFQSQEVKQEQSKHHDVRHL